MAQATETARPTRAEETRRARRMQPGDVTAPGIKLGLDESKVDRRTYEYRWVKDAPGRIEAMKRRDWDIVDENAKPDGNGLGTVSTVNGGVGEAGKPYNMVLMKKFKDWYENDQKTMRKPLDEMDKAIRSGTAHEKSGERDLAGVTYTPEGTVNSISR